MAPRLLTLVCTVCSSGDQYPEPVPVKCSRCGGRLDCRGIIRVVDLVEKGSS